ncbi:MAG: hypothetical protein KC643_12690 [Nitrospira sp.]|nr:hypothetical protein [Nitrospira sp.]
MGYKTEQIMCLSCGGFGSFTRTDWVDNPNPGGQTSIPVTRQESCSSCFGSGRISQSVYEPDPVPLYPVQEKKESASKKKKGKFNLTEFGYSSEGSEEFKVINTRFVAKIIALLGAVSFFYFTYDEFSAVSQGLIWSCVVSGVLYFILTRPFRRFTSVIATILDYVVKIIVGISLVVYWILLIAFISYILIKAFQLDKMLIGS